MSEQLAISEEIITNKIYTVRQQKVMLDSDLADLYTVETKRQNEQVRRNKERFPQDFMFQLTKEEWENLKSQFATSSWGGRRTLPYVFSEHGVLMLSSVLSSKRAVAVNIHIMRIFIKVRNIMLTHKDVMLEMEQFRKHVNMQDKKIEMVLEHLKQFIDKRNEPARTIGFKRRSER